MSQFDWYAQGAAMYAKVRRMADEGTAARRPPRAWAAFEDLAIYCCGHGKDLIMVRTDDPRIKGNRDINATRAFYKE